MSQIKKTKIPKAVRRAVWLKYIGKKWQGKCNVSWCSNKFDVLDSWHVGHNIPESKGGSLSISNLRPICASCNLGMGNDYTIDEWDKTFKFNKKEKVAAKALTKLCCPIYKRNKTVSNKK